MQKTTTQITTQKISTIEQIHTENSHHKKLATVKLPKTSHKSAKNPPLLCRADNSAQELYVPITVTEISHIDDWMIGK